MSVVERVRRYNQGRDEARLRLKWERMRRDALGFYRGTAHLFYEDFRDFPAAPRGWLCGDLHLENFGSYRSDNRLTYFDINDFDEACRGPVTADLARLLGSMALEAQERRWSSAETRELLKQVLKIYAAELAGGKARWVERATARGVIAELLDGLQCRGRKKLLASRTVIAGRKRSLLVDGRKALPLEGAEEHHLEKLAERELPDWKVLDAARRIAGNGSLGVPRFVLLVRDPEGQELLLDLKQAQRAVGLRANDWTQPDWVSDAERVATVQSMMQVVPVAFLRPLEWRGASWILRELLPQEDRVEVAQATDREFEDFARSLGALVAWSVLRASGRRGAATADELAEFAPTKHWRGALADLAWEVAERTREQWEEFREAPL